MKEAPKPQRRSRNPAARQAFAARRDEIASALKADKFMREIYAELEFPGSYMQFTRYCARLLKELAGEPAPAAKAGPRRTAAAIPPTAAASPAPGVASAAPPRAEGAGPRRVPRKEPTPWDPSTLDSAELFGKRTDEP